MIKLPIFSATMPFALTNSIDIELVIEGNRSELFQKIISQVPSTSSGGDSHSPASAPGQVDKTSSLTDESNMSVDQTGVMENGTSAQSLHVDDKGVNMQDDLGFYYVVQDSYLSDNGSERIFKVKHMTSEFYYCAFKFKDWVVCPAFLASWFELTDYACLDVAINDSHYYYILLDNENDVALSYILDKNSQFLSRYFFRAPVSWAMKVLKLNFKSKDIKIFIDITVETSERNKAFHAELLNYRPDPSKVLNRSKVDPSYYLVPIESVKKFRGRDRLPFSPNFDLIPAAFVREGSESLSGLCSLWRKDNLHSDEIEKMRLDGENLKNAFVGTDYKREEYIMEKFLSHIRYRFNECKSKKMDGYYCSMFTFFQSSGYGKSRFMIRLGSKTPTFYSSLLQGSGFPFESFFLTNLLKELNRIAQDGVYTGTSTVQCWMNNITTAVYIYILRILFVILKKPKSTGIRESFEIDLELEDHEFFNSLKGSRSERFEKIFQILFRGLGDICNYPKEVPFDGENTLALNKIQIVQKLFLNRFSIDFIPKEYLTNDLEGKVMALLESLKTKGSGLPSIFVIDEYQVLKKHYNWSFRDARVRCGSAHDVFSERTPFNIFQRVFRMFSNTWERLILIVVGKSGRTCLPLPDKDKDPSMAHGTSDGIIDNFSLVQTYSVNSDIFYSINANMFPNDKGVINWVDFLKSDFRKEEYFKFGRPLNYAVFKDLACLNDGEFGAKFKDCREFKFLAFKLLGDREYGEMIEIGFLYSLLNLAFGTNFLPDHVGEENLIENHLMTLIVFQREYNISVKLIGGFLPEGAINFLSARYFVQYLRSLSTVLSSSVERGLCDNGNLIKLLAQFILLQNIFRCIDTTFEEVRKLVFQPVLLKDFLLKLADTQNKITVNEYFKFNPLLKDSLVSFGYFEHFPENLLKNPFDMMARLLFRGSAINLNRFYQGIDLMIPLVLKDGRISFVGIKLIFNRDEKLIDEEVNSACEQMSFPKMFSELQSDCPFGLIILVICEFAFDVSIIPKRNKGTTASACKDPLVEPSILVFKGIPPSCQPDSIKEILKIATIDTPYWNLDPNILKKCDSIYDLVKETPSQQESVESKDQNLSPSNPMIQDVPVAQPIGSRNLRSNRTRASTSSGSMRGPSSK